MPAEAPRGRLLAGARAMSPALIGVVPFGIVTGVVSAAAGMTPAEGLAFSILSFSGIAQLITIQLYAAGAPAAVILLTVAVMSLRLVMYSAWMAQYFAHDRWRRKLAVAYFLTDHAYALSVVDFNHHPDRPNKHWFVIGTGVVSWLVWNVAVAFGMLVGAQVPPSWSLDFAVTLTFLALLVPVLQDRPSGVAAVVGGAVAVAAYALPLKLGLIVAAVAGVAAAALWQSLARR